MNIVFALCRIFLSATLVYSVISCSSFYDKYDKGLVSYHIKQLQEEAIDLDSPQWKTQISFTRSKPGFYPPAQKAVKEYRKRLQKISPWNTKPVEHLVGFISCKGTSENEYRLGINIFFPQDFSYGTLFFVHGYLGHSGLYSWFFDQMVQKGWIVVALDLPGHGLSTGTRASIKDFRDYGDAVQALLAWAAKSENLFLRPWIQGGFSLGGAASLDYYRRDPRTRPELLLLIAPLVRTVWYDAGVFFFNLFKDQTFSWNSRFDGYLKETAMPSSWFQALATWNKSLDSTSTIHQKTVLLQGIKDEVIDTHFNVSFLLSKIPQMEVIYLPDLSHHLLLKKNEQQEFLDKLLNYLSQQKWEH